MSATPTKHLAPPHRARILILAMTTVLISLGSTAWAMACVWGFTRVDRFIDRLTADDRLDD